MMNGMTQLRKTTQFRKLLERPGALVAPGVYDALSARICEMAGFEVVQHSGYGTAAVLLARPDVGLIGFAEMCAQVRNIAHAVNIPVLGDSDNGFGNAVNAFYTVREYCLAGAAGLFMEDQVAPKRCGHMAGKQVVSREEMLGKLKAALDARGELDPDFVVMYRTDALAVNGLDDAIDRAKAAVDVGVDMIFVEALETRAQMERVAREVHAPLMLNLIEGGKTPLVTVKEAESMGFKYIVPALTSLYAAARGMLDVMRAVREEGVSEKYLDRLCVFKDFAKIVRLDDIRSKEETYLPKDVLESKYHGNTRIVAE